MEKKHSIFFLVFSSLFFVVVAFSVLVVMVYTSSISENNFVNDSNQHLSTNLIKTNNIGGDLTVTPCSLSKFGRKKYKCTGTCFCSPSVNKRRVASSIIAIPSRAIIYIGAAMTTFLAVQSAKEYFHAKCFDTLDGCDVSDIDVELDEEDCEELTNEPLNDFDENFVENIPEKKGKRMKYLCSGKCMAKVFKLDQTIEQAKKYGCEKLSKEAMILVDLLCDSDPNFVARYSFITNHLSPFCKKESEHVFDYKWIQDGEEKKMQKKMPLCAGYQGVTNPSVTCVEQVITEDDFL